MISTSIEGAIYKEVKEIEGHVHSWERWFGAAASPSGETHIADSISTSKTAFVIDAGNDTWGAWVQIIGSSDTPAQTGKTKYDLHRMVTTAFETNNSAHSIQIACGASGTAALTAGTYTEFVMKMGAGNTLTPPADIIMRRCDAGGKVWARNWAHGVNTSTMSFFIGIHEYNL